MNVSLRQKAFLGLGSFFVPLPKFLINNSTNKSARLICRQTGELTNDERRVHQFVVTKLTDSNQPVNLVTIAEDLDLSLIKVEQIVKKLEDLKVYFYRYDSNGINWAYPVTSEPRDFQLRFDSGENCTAA